MNLAYTSPWMKVHGPIEACRKVGSQSDRIRGQVGFLPEIFDGGALKFDKPADYAAFEKLLYQAWERTKMRLVKNR